MLVSQKGNLYYWSRNAKNSMAKADLSHDHQFPLHDHATAGVVNSVKIKPRGHQGAMLVPGVPFPFGFQVCVADQKTNMDPGRLGIVNGKRVHGEYFYAHFADAPF